MLRTIVLSLAFAVGPNLPTLCKAWCAAQAAETGCRHHPEDRGGGTTRVETNSSCPDQVLVATLHNEDTRRRLVSDGVTAAVVPRSTLRSPLAGFRAVDRPHIERSDLRSIRPTPLRI